VPNSLIVKIPDGGGRHFEFPGKIFAANFDTRAFGARLAD